MATYMYENPKNGEVVSVKQGMLDDHEYIDEEGLRWKRIYISPQTSIKDKPIDLRDSKDRDLYNSVYKKRYEYNKKKGKIDENGKIK